MLLYSGCLLSFLGFAWAQETTSRRSSCDKIAAVISPASAVFFPNTPQYQKDIFHYSAYNTANSKCSVEPGTDADLGKILQILGNDRTPFAVKSGGHSTNPGFSSSTGVQITLSRFSTVKFDAQKQTATIGTGLLWEDVYAALEPRGVTVIGGRVPGVGVGGFALGGGFSWKTNQFGLTVDNIVAMELVKPNGKDMTVTKASDPDLFFALRGGFNNFGIVTKITMKTYPQGQVWGGFIIYTPDQFAAVNAANTKFQQVTDPKAQTIQSFSVAQSVPIGVQMLFYDGPTPPAGIFDDFLNIPSVGKDISTRSYLSLVNSFAASNATAGMRQVFHTVSFQKITKNIIDATMNETFFWSQKLSSDPGLFISYSLEPFLPSVLTHGTSASAWPPSRTRPILPLLMLFGWVTTPDNTIRDSLHQSASQLNAVSAKEGQGPGLPLYNNYALDDTPLNQIYGGNLPRLHRIKTDIDPQNVMGLAGGFKF